MKASSVCFAVVVTALANSPTFISEDIELRDLDIAGWDCLEHAEGTAKTQDGIERNRLKNRSPENLTALPVQSLDTTAFLKKVGEYHAYIQGKRRADRLQK